MNPALRTAATGMAAQQTRTEVIANNLANVNTTGFKRGRAQFEDLLYQNMQGPQVLGSSETNTSPAIQVGRGTHLTAVVRLHTQGALEQTGRSMDVAINGEGFFPVQLPSGTAAYTRDGSFQISDQGVLVTSDGFQVGAGIKIPSDVTSVTISPTGVVSGSKGAGTEATELGRLELARFANPSGLESMGQNLLAATPASGEATTGFPGDEGMGSLVQGQLEGSNVEIVQEMVDMISAQRAYELNSKAVKAADEMSQTATEMVR
ncbi:MAG: flgG [Gemmatimonadetes bacterium]|nr:flgG [Gemmatimonadota bacterium]